MNLLGCVPLKSDASFAKNAKRGFCANIIYEDRLGGYVNGEYRGEDALGLLMHDFNCISAADMHYELMSVWTQYLKENPEGVSIMCKAMEDMRNEAALAKSYEIAKALWNDGMHDLERISRLVKLTLAQVKEAIGIQTA